MVNLFLAFVWLVLGIILVGWHWLHPETGVFRIWASNVSVGWLALVLAAYNLIRWWSARSHARALQRAEAARRAREAKNDQRGSDPAFLFRDDQNRGAGA